MPSMQSPGAAARAVEKALGELPVPGAEAQAHSERLIAHIIAAMEQAGGAIPFEQFMAEALYAPGLGYYSAGSHKLGEAGDFVTAPELSPLFSRTLARQCAEVLGRLGGGELLEFGAGSGVMAADILAELASLDCLPERYLIMEVSADLKQRQRETLQRKVPQLAERVVWLDALPKGGFRGVVLANEVLDAMPVHLFRITGGRAQERFVAFDGECFVWRDAAPSSARLAERLADLQQRFDLAEGYTSELNLHAEQWLHGLAGFLETGVALLIDYGFPAHEYYHPERHGGTLMCHYRHRAHPDPLLLPGLQDITAHVDFTAVAEAALAAGLQVMGFTNQANFLLASGLTELAELAAGGEVGDERERLAQANQIRRLTMPGEMGELFKVMALGRGDVGPLRGFMLRDERARL